LKREILSDAAVFRRGFYSCSEECREEVSEYSEMTRTISPQNKAMFKNKASASRGFKKRSK
jgi:hypothetical protein